MGRGLNTDYTDSTDKFLGSTGGDGFFLNTDYTDSTDFVFGECVD